MSTASMQQSSTKTFSAIPISFPIEPAKAESSIDLLVASSHFRPDDRVMVIGRKLSDHLIALAHCGCRTATGVDPASLYLRKDMADVVWITGVTEIETQMTEAVARMVSPRVIVIELVDPASFGQLRGFLRRLREMGFGRQSHRRTASGLVVTAHRAEWLQWIA